MSRPRGGAKSGAIAAYRRIYQTEGAAGLAELAEQRLDAIAGPHALTDEERAIHRACRHRFGWYDPASPEQSQFIAGYKRAHAESLLLEAA